MGSFLRASNDRNQAATNKRLDSLIQANSGARTSVASDVFQLGSNRMTPEPANQEARDSTLADHGADRQAATPADPSQPVMPAADPDFTSPHADDGATSSPTEETVRHGDLAAAARDDAPEPVAIPLGGSDGEVDSEAAPNDTMLGGDNPGAAVFEAALEHAAGQQARSQKRLDDLRRALEREEQKLAETARVADAIRQYLSAETSDTAGSVLEFTHARSG